MTECIGRLWEGCGVDSVKTKWGKNCPIEQTSSQRMHSYISEDFGAIGYHLIKTICRCSSL